MISEIYILNKSLELLIKKNYRKEIPEITFTVFTDYYCNNKENYNFFI